MIDDTHPLSGVNGVFNGVFLRGNVLGDAMFYGVEQESFQQQVL